MKGEPCGWVGCDDPFQDQAHCRRCIAEVEKIRAAFDFIEQLGMAEGSKAMAGYSRMRPSLEVVESALGDAERLDFDLGRTSIPAAWARLREEARPVFAALNVWQADLVPLARS